MKNLAWIALLLLPAATAQPQDDSVMVPVMIWGHGSDPCGSFVLAMEKHSHKQRIHVGGESFPTEARSYFQWAGGYLTAAALLDAEKYPAPNDSFDGTMVWLRSWCTTNPTEPFHDAVRAYADAHGSPIEDAGG